MQAKAVAKTVRIAPRKAAFSHRFNSRKRSRRSNCNFTTYQPAASPIVEKVLNSAIANAEHNYEMDPDNLVVSEAMLMKVNT